MPKPPVDPAIIEKAPVTAGSQVAGVLVAKQQQYLEIIADLSAELESEVAETAKLKGKKTVDDVKASMMEPYANRVFWFVVWYCIAVGAMLVAEATCPNGFHLSDTVLGIIAGSTAVSVIGLIGMVISGLFGVTRSK